VRQGDPLSPLLFNLAADILSEILNKVKRKGIVTVVVHELVEGGLTHLQYADDTIIFMEDTESNIVNLKFLLFCFEEMSGLRINYNKSEVFVVGGDGQHAEAFAQAFNCKSDHFPMKYLGIPIDKDRISKKTLSEPANKVERRLET
jgi:hypothetical protein